MKEGKPLAYTNYFRYLWTCCITFLVLGIISMALNLQFRVDKAVFDPNHHVKVKLDVLARHILWPGSIFDHLKSSDMDTIFGWALAVVFINGSVFLVATLVLEKWCDRPLVHQKVSRAIWVHNLPVREQRRNPFTCNRFGLTKDDLMQVERELSDRFNEALSEYKDKKRRREKQEQQARDRRPSRSSRIYKGGAGHPGGTKESQLPNPTSSRRPFSSFEAEDSGQWVVDDQSAHLPHHSRKEPSEGLSVGNYIGAKGIFRDADGSAVFVKKVKMASRIERVWVVPAAKEWREASQRLEQACGDRNTFTLWAQYYQLPCKSGTWNSFWHRRYQSKSTAAAKRVAKLEADLLRIRLRTLGICGSAFVLFCDPEDCEMMLGREPEWKDCWMWACGSNKLNFGHMPFTSVTLDYEPAPHPDDLAWENMDVSRWWSEFVWFFSAFVLLTVFMLAGQLVILILHLFSWGDQVSSHYASVILLVINKSLLPFPVAWIALAARFRRKTESELRQMHLNFWLLIVNTIVVPLLGLQLAQDILPIWSQNPMLIRCVSIKLLQLPKRLFVGYLFDVTFLSNLYQVIVARIFESIWWLTCKLTAEVAPRDFSEFPSEILKRQRERNRETRAEACAQDPPRPAKAPSPVFYSFGYYYAWTLSLVALVLLSSAEVPVTLFIAALCFFVKIIVDWCNLRNKVYEIGPEHEGKLNTWAVFYMRLCVIAWWFMIGLGVVQLCSEKEQCPDWVFPGCYGMVVLACLVTVASVFRLAYASSIRRFRRPGGQTSPNAEPATGEATHASQSSPISWDPTPHFEASAVEKVVQEVEDRPNLREWVLKLLDQGVSVEGVRLRIGKASFMRQHKSGHADYTQQRAGPASGSVRWVSGLIPRKPL